MPAGAARRRAAAGARLHRHRAARTLAGVDALPRQLDDTAGDGAVTIALWCLLIAGLLPYVATAISKAGADYDNRDPRAWLARQHGYRRRAGAAAMNAFEALPLFA